jgi:hypothetical protein
MTAWTQRRAALLLVAALLAFFGPPLAREQVLYPHDNAAEAGLANVALDQFGRVFGDQSNLYVPEVHAHLQGAHASWLPSWNPHNELGRPLFPCGIARGWILGHALSRVISDALTYYTWSAVAAVVGSAVFAFLFLRARGLHPLACLTGALGISIGPIFGGWQFVTLVQWGFCWALAALCGIESWLRRPTFWNGAWIVFSVHSVLMSGFPQHVLMLGWIVGTWLLVRTLESRASRAERLRMLGAVTALALLGVLSVAPTWIDLYVDWRASARADYVSSSNAWAGEPQRRAALWVGLTSVMWPDDPGCLSFSLSPLYAGLLGVGLLTWRRAHGWVWIVWLGLSLAGTLYTGANAALRALGLSLSEWPPIYAGLLPCAILAALGADRVLRSDARQRGANVLACLLPFVTAALHLSGVVRPFEPVLVVYALALALATLALVARPRPLLLAVLLGAVVVADGQVLVRWQPRAAVHTDSPLAAELRRRTADGSRFAWVGPRLPGYRFLQPNQEIVLGLSSVHTYDHLMSRAFSEWSRELGTAAYRDSDYDRLFDQLGLHALQDEEFLAAAGVSTLVSIEPLDAQLVADPLPIAGVHVSSLRRRGPLQAHLGEDDYAHAAPGQVRAPLERLREQAPAERVPTGFDDRLSFRFEARERESLLFVSQRFDARWEARAGERRLQGVCINGLYQGVVIPPGVEALQLEFRVWSRFALPIQCAFLLLGLAAVAAALRRRALGR